jgi:hypothetical protein
MVKEYALEVLERPLRLSDLQTKHGKDVMDSFKSGHTQPFPIRDRSGRRILVTCVNHAMKYKADIRVRWGFFYDILHCYLYFLTNFGNSQYKTYQYLFLVASSDAETQRKGTVFIMWGRRNPPWPDKEELQSKLYVLSVTCAV